MINWHRLFGLTLKDFFTGSNYQVDLEKDLTVQEQYLDIAIIRKSEGQPITEWPDGFDNLSEYNLVSYKSLREPLDGWTIDELISYYVLYRKQLSPSVDELLPAEKFQLYLVATRYPQKRHRPSQFQEIQPGVYQINSYTRPIQIIILSKMPEHQRNALWQLFSGKGNGFSFGNKHYHWRIPKNRGLLNPLYKLYQQEDVIMPYTFEDFEREYLIEVSQTWSPKDLLEVLPIDALLKEIPIKQRLKEVPIEERLKEVPIEERLKEVPIKERLKGLPPAEIEEYLSELKKSQ
jgi:hypothetical protein